jgi:hypothetical protein
MSSARIRLSQVFSKASCCLCLCTAGAGAGRSLRAVTGAAGCSFAPRPASLPARHREYRQSIGGSAAAGNGPLSLGAAATGGAGLAGACTADTVSDERRGRGLAAFGRRRLRRSDAAVFPSDNVGRDAGALRSGTARWPVDAGGAASGAGNSSSDAAGCPSASTGSSVTSGDASGVPPSGSGSTRFSFSAALTVGASPSGRAAAVSDAVSAGAIRLR